MADDRLHAALDRIEHALARLEGRPDESAWEARHIRLRVAAEEALAGLDRLLEAPR